MVVLENRTNTFGLVMISSLTGCETFMFFGLEYALMRCQDSSPEEASEAFPPAEVLPPSLSDFPFLTTFTLLLLTLVACWVAVRVYRERVLARPVFWHGVPILLSLLFIGLQVYQGSAYGFSFHGIHHDPLFFVALGSFLFYFSLGLVLFGLALVVAHMKPLQRFYVPLNFIALGYSPFLFCGWLVLAYARHFCG